MLLRAFPLLAAAAVLFALPVSAVAHEAGSGSSARQTYGWGGMELSNDFMRGETATAAALAPEPQPLTGKGSNMRIVANVPFEASGGTTRASDIELQGDYAYISSPTEGLVIIDIKDPRNPQRAGVFKCFGGVDVQLSPDARFAILGIESPSVKSCKPGNEGFLVLDISDKANPREVSFVGKDKLIDGAHNVTLDWPRVYVNQYTPTYNKFEIFDISDPSAPKSIGVLPAQGQGSHDLQVDHRPDGKAYAYSASIGFTDVLDVTDPTKPKFVQRFPASDHGVGISHGAEPNFDRSLMIESDEYAGGLGNGGCGGAGGAQVAPAIAGQANVASPGALHLLRLAKDGRINTLDPGGRVVDQIGAYNLPAQANESADEGCTAHVFWQAPDENRMVVAWYGRGTRIVDFSKPNAPVELGNFIPTNGDTWSAKAHKGFIFTGDIVRGMDVLEYTGEKCERWPTTSGAAEIQRARYQGVPAPADAPKSTPAGCGGKATNEPAVPLRATPGNATVTPVGQGPAALNREGGYRFARTFRAPGRRGSSARRTVTLEVVSVQTRRVIGRLRYRVRSGSLARVRASVGGPVGRYGYRIRAGRRGKVLKRGSFTVKRISRVRVPGATQTRLRLARVR